jgi:hypothetical protein
MEAEFTDGSDSDDEITQFLQRSSGPPTTPSSKCIGLNPDCQTQLNGEVKEEKKIKNRNAGGCSDHWIGPDSPVDSCTIVDLDDESYFPSSLYSAKKQCLGLHLASVERPLTFQGGNLDFRDDSRGKVMFKKINWYYHVLDRYLEAGYRAETLVNLFESLPRALEDVLKQGLHALEILKSSGATANPPPSSENLSPPASQPDDEYCPFLTAEDSLWQARTNCGYLRLEWDPVSQNRKHAVMNSAFASLNGLHPEEMVSRIGNREASLGRTNDVDFLACLIHDLLTAGAARTERYGRVCDARGRPFLARVISIKDFDSAGRVWQARSAARALAGGEGGELVGMEWDGKGRIGGSVIGREEGSICGRTGGHG